MGKQAVNKAILSSSEMHQFCKDTALKILNFFEQENFPVMAEDIKPFLEVITEEVENFQHAFVVDLDELDAKEDDLSTKETVE